MFKYAIKTEINRKYSERRLKKFFDTTIATGNVNTSNELLNSEISNHN